MPSAECCHGQQRMLWEVDLIFMYTVGIIENISLVLGMLASAVAWVFLFSTICLWLHELAHAAAARAVNFEIIEVRLGGGPELLRWKIGDWYCHVHLFPYVGYCLASPSDFKCYRRKKFIYIAAGPLLNFFLLALGGLYLMPLLTSLGMAEGDAQYIAILLFCTAFIYNLGSMLPTTLVVRGMRVESDMLNMIKILFFKKQEPPCFSSYHINLLRLLLAEEKMRAARYYLKTKKLGAWESIPDRLKLAVYFFDLGMVKRARLLFLQILQEDGLKVEIEKEVLDRLACLSIYHNRQDLLTEGMKWIERAVEKYPDVVTFRGTLGALAAELGQYERAENVLREVLEKSKNLTDRMIVTIYLAWIAAITGRKAEAKRHLRRIPAHRHVPVIVVRKREETKQVLKELRT
jgi:tetratricopeptide (TPR) repeat protein